ncbi:MAG: nuclear transport factor 2 family protein [Candidatus Eremiobacteraeota bacterium]|nr:nuclear transport factor 2 family protein [Candidatus Eremiobacteraeota bacterium]
MKHYFSSILAMFVFAAASLGFAAAAGDPIVAEVTKANDDMQLAAKNYDMKAIDMILTKDFVLVQNRGSVVDRAAFLADIGDKSATWIENRSSDITIHHYNDNTALAIGILHMKYKYKNKVNEMKLRYIDVWVKQNGQWKWASPQVAHMTPPAKT